MFGCRNACLAALAVEEIEGELNKNPASLTGVGFKGGGGEEGGCS